MIRFTPLIGLIFSNDGSIGFERKPKPTCHTCAR